MSNKVKCLYGEKGIVRMIPEKFTNDYKYMQRHNLHKAQEPNLDPIIMETETDLKLDIEPEFTPETIQGEGFTKEQLFILLDQKGVEYKKTYGIEKLTQLLNS